MSGPTFSPVSLVDQAESFEMAAWLTSSGRRNPTAAIAAPGFGKSTLLAAILRHDLFSGRPQVLFDPTGGTITQFIGSLNEVARGFERQWWELYHTPLPPEWQCYVEDQLDQLARRVNYVDMNGNSHMKIYNRLVEDESLFAMSQRILEVFRRMDPALESASVEGYNAIYKLGTYTGMILSALDLQITKAEDLIRNPEQWQDRFDEALSRYPEVWPAVRFFREYIKAKPEVRTRRSDSLLTKLLVFTADPKMMAKFGTDEQSINQTERIKKKQTDILDFSKIDSEERKRFLLLWALSDEVAFAKYRGVAGRQEPMGLIIDEVSQLLGYQQNGQSIMAADINALVSVLSRNYGLLTLITFQSLTQLDRQMQSALLQGNLLIGAIPNPDDAQIVARYFFRFNPFWEKKREPIYFGEPDPTIIDTSISYSDYSISVHEHARLVPKVIGYRTVEYSLDDQLQLLTQEIQGLPKYKFLVRASGIEGQLARTLRLLDISHLDTGVYPDVDRVAEACRRLTKISKEQRLTDIQPGHTGETHQQVPTLLGDSSRMEVLAIPQSDELPNAADLPAATDADPTLSDALLSGGIFEHQDVFQA